MAADVETNVRLTAGGGDQASAEIEKASKSLDNLGKKQEQLKTRFGQRFSNVGLQLFAQDALRATGVTANLSPAIAGMSNLLTQGAAAFGLATGGTLLLVGALTTLAAVLYKVYQGNHQSLESLQALDKAQSTSLNTTRSSIDAINTYAATAQDVPPELRAWQAAEEALGAAQAKRLVITKQDEIQAIEAVLRKQAERKTALEDELKNEEAMSFQLAKLTGDMATMEAGGQAFSNVKKKSDDLSLSILENKAKVEELKASLALLSSKGSDDLKRLGDADRLRVETARKHSQEMAKLAYEEAKARSDAYYESYNAMVEASNKAGQELYESSKRVSDLIGGTFGNAFAHALVEGKGFTQAMKGAFKQMATQIIADIIRVLIQWTILNAVTGGRAGAVMRVFGGGIGHAIGGQVMVDRPTQFLAGEGGPEMVTFTPMSGGGGATSTSAAPPTSGGGGGLQIGSVVTHVYGVTDPGKIADQVGRQIIERIRGAGQLAFVRA